MLKDKKILILGVANKRSIAWGVAQHCQDQGAQLCLTYQNDRMKRLMEKTVRGMDPQPLILPCDVGQEQEIKSLFEVLGEKWGRIDGLVHSIAFANRDDLQGRFMETSRAGFGLAHDVSAYSLIILAKYAQPLMTDGGSIICMSYLGGERVFPNYNVMGVAKASLEMTAKYLASDLGVDGIRVNIVSPGPLRTLAAAGISGFSTILDSVKEKAPLKRNVTQDDVGKASVFLLSDWSAGITGDTIHVDAGYHIMGM